MKVKVKVKVKAKLKRNMKRNSLLPVRRKTCRFCSEKVKGTIDYKDIKMLESFVKERGAIVATRVTGNCAKHQRQIAEAVKMARFLALFPYVKM